MMTIKLSSRDVNIVLAALRASEYARDKLRGGLAVLGQPDAGEIELLDLCERMVAQIHAQIHAGN